MGLWAKPLTQVRECVCMYGECTFSMIAFTASGAVVRRYATWPIPQTTLVCHTVNTGGVLYGEQSVMSF